MTYVTYQEACDFAEKLTAKFRKELPQGYVIRLPTAAEWLVAHRVGMPEDVSDRQAFQLGWFGQGCDGNAGSSNMRLYYKDKNLPIPLVKDIWPDFVANKINPKNEWKRFSSQFAPVPVGLKPADKLGLFDMMGNCFEMCYDRSKIIQDHGWNNEFMCPVRPYAEQGDELVDPVDRSGDVPMMVSDYLTPRTNCRDVSGVPYFGRTPFLGIRLCLGPDLVAGKTAETPSAGKTMASAKAPTPKCKMVNGRPAPLKFELAKGVDLVLEGCPAGKFTMGYDFRPEGGWNWDGKAAPKHEVVITRPFWIGKYQVTRDQLDTLGCGQFTDEQMMAALNAMDGAGGKHCAAQSALAEAERLCRKLNEKFCDRLPRGYVFRLPTDAEWEYASKAGNYLKSNPAMAYGVPGKYFAGYAQYADVRKELIQKAMKWDKRVPPGPVGSKSPNDWGIYDAVGNGDELVLDRLPCSNEDVVRCDKTYKHVVVYLQPAKDKTDPLHYQDGSDYYCLVRAEALTKFAFKAGGERPATFRVCLGPDLVAEKTAKK